MRILDVLFVGREPGSGELIAVSMSAEGSARMTGRLLSFRLDESTRRGSTKCVLESEVAEMARSLAETLEPGGAVAAMLVEHAWAMTLGETIARLGATEKLNEFVEPGKLTALDHRLETLGSG